MRVAIVGVGGIGGWLGAHLAQTSDVVFVGREGSPHTAAMQSAGLRLIEPNGTIELPSATVAVPGTPAFDGMQPVDLAIICVKTWQVEDVVAATLPLLRADGCIMTTQNGVDAPVTAAAAVGADRVVASVCRVGAMVDSPGVVSKSAAFTGGSLELGELAGGGGSDRIDRLCAMFAESGIAATSSADIQKAMWTKLSSISGFGAVGAVARAPVEVLCKVEPCRQLVAAAIDEVLAVAQAEGVAVDLSFVRADRCMKS
jgi:2-dehydropantoate 2-reductase